MKSLLRVSMAAFVLAAAAAAEAQVPQPRLGATQPAGARAGTTVELRIIGPDLDRMDRLLFSHPGITARPVTLGPDLFYPEARNVENQFKVTVAADVPPGIYEVRAAGYYGISNARRFVVGDGEEILEKEPDNDAGQAVDLAAGTTANGTTDAQNFDFYRFAAQKGKRYVVDAAALRLDSRAQLVLALLDPAGREILRSVATKFTDPILDYTAEADGPHVIRLHDLLYRGGDEFFYRLAVTTSPWIDFIDPPVVRPGADNAVTVYGRNLPGGKPAEGVSVGCRPLERLDVTIKGPTSAAAAHAEAGLLPAEATADFMTYRLASPHGRSNPVRLLVADEPLFRESEPDADPEKALRVTVPAQVVGRFHPEGDRDWVVFEAKKGEKIWIEVFSQRLGHPTDPLLVVQQLTTDDKGVTNARELQEVDDQPSPLPGQGNNPERRYRLGPEDPAVLFVPPADGRFRVMIRDLYFSSQGDPRFFYRLVIRPARPDFRLVAIPVDSFPVQNRIAPSTCVLRRGGVERVRVAALRSEGFEGTIRVEPESLPPGVSARALVLGPTETSKELLLMAAADAPAFAGQLRLTGRSEIDGKAVSRPARSVEVAWAINTQTEGLVSRLTDWLPLAVDASYTAPFAAQVGDGRTYRMARGGKLKLPAKLVKNADFKDSDKAQVKLNAVGLPGQGNNRPIVAKELTLTVQKPDGELEIDVAANAPTGVQNFFLSGEITLPFARDPERVKKMEEEKKRIDQVSAKVAEDVKKAEQARTQADQKVQQAQQAAKAAEQSRAKADEALKKEKTAETEGALAKADEALKEAREKAAAAEAEQKKALEEEARARELAKAGDLAKKNVADEAKRAVDMAKPANIKVLVASLLITLDVVPHPATLTLAAGTVSVKAGEKTELLAEIEREFGFEDEVKLELQGANGFKLAEPAVFAKGQDQVRLVIAAEKNVKPGAYALTVRAPVKFGTASGNVDVALQVKVEEPPKP